MTGQLTFTVDELSRQLGLEYRGDGNRVIDSVGTLQHATGTQLSFLSASRYSKYLVNSTAGAILVNEVDAERCKNCAIISSDPYVDYARASQLLYPVSDNSFETSIDASAVVAGDSQLGNPIVLSANVVIGVGVSLGDYVSIGAGTVIEDGVVIGKGTRIESNVTIKHHVVIGEQSLVHSGVVIGSDGFGFANDAGKWLKIPQVGTVLIGNHVEIGANTTIDRGAIENTQIADGVILDNLVQIGHNVNIGKHTAIAAHTAVAGSTTIGEYCMIGGCVAIAGHLTIADHVTLSGVTMVSHSIGDQGSYSGIPSQETRSWRRNIVRLRQIDQLFKRVKKLEKK